MTVVSPSGVVSSLFRVIMNVYKQINKIIQGYTLHSGLETFLKGLCDYIPLYYTLHWYLLYTTLQRVQFIKCLII